MDSKAGTSQRMAAAAAGILLTSLALGADPPDSARRPDVARPAGPGKVGEGNRRISVDVARDRAKLMHKIYAATLETIHHHYFQRGRSILPARAMEDVFATIAEDSKIQARWIAVNTKAMSLDHEPESPFEKKAADQIASGKGEFERVEGNYYLRAGAIPLGSGCIGCHAGFGAPPTKSPRFAGLVISVPLDVE